ncbi:MAG: hypothetical protein AB7F22_09545 [Reyranella sp.]|uniref:hypothetical protein n=1 Tax=Reyranella sp. TaxID=1929291 RepID=UPI003D12E19E
MGTLKFGQPRAVWRVLGFAAICLAVLAIGADGAAAENCLEQVKRIAEAHDIATDPPKAAPGKGNKDVTPRELSDSGGVVEPPIIHDRSVISPPDQRSPMPTMPDVAPDKTQAANRTALQAILVAARSEAERNNEEGCREGLARAAKVLERME